MKKGHLHEHEWLDCFFVTVSHSAETELAETRLSESPLCVNNGAVFLLVWLPVAG